MHACRHAVIPCRGAVCRRKRLHSHSILSLPCSLFLQHKARGNAALQAGKPTEAIEEYTAAIRLDGANHVYYSNRSAAYLQHKDAPNALEDAIACIGLNASFAKGYSRKGAALHALRRYQDAVAAYEEGLAVAPDDPGLQKGLASVQQEKEQGGPRPTNTVNANSLFGPDMIAQMALHPRLRSYLNDPDVMAKMQMVQKDPNLLSGMLQDPKMMDILSTMLGGGGGPGGGGDAEEDTNNERAAPAAAPAPAPEPAPAPMEVEEDWSHLSPEERKVKENQKAAMAKKDEGNTLYKSKQFDEALAAYDAAIALDPSNMTFLNNKAAVYFTQKEYATCIATCLEAVEVGKQHQAPFEDRAKAYTRVAKAYQKQGDVAQAIEYCKKAQLEAFDKNTQRLLKTMELDKKKADAAAYLSDEKAEEAKQRGNEFFRNKEWVKAVAEYEEAVKRAPKNAPIRNNLAAALCKIMDFGGATRHIETAIEIDPQYVKAWARKGDIELLRKDYHKAKESYEKGLALDGTSAACREGLRKVGEAISVGRRNMSDAEKQQQAEQAMQDPEIQAILQDPVTQQVLKDLRENPAAGQQAMSDPVVRANFNKLIAAG